MFKINAFYEMKVLGERERYVRALRIEVIFLFFPHNSIFIALSYVYFVKQQSKIHNFLRPKQP